MLPFVLTKTVVFLCKNYDNQKFEIVVDSPKVKLFLTPVAEFDAKSILCKSKNDNDVVKLDDLSVKIRILPLLSGNFHINSFEVKNYEYITHVDKSTKLDKDFFAKIRTAKFWFNRIKIDNFKMLIHSDEAKTPVIYKGNDLLVQQKNRYNSFKLKSELNINNNISKCDFNLFFPKNNDLKKTVFDVSVSNLDLARFENYMQNYLPKDLVKINGVIDVNANKNELITKLKNCSIIMKDSAKSIVFPSVLQINSNFYIKRDYIDFRNVDISSDKLHLSFNGKIFDYFGKSMPTVNFNIQIDPSRTEDFIKLLPPTVNEDLNVYKLKKYMFYGDVIGNISIKGRLPEPNLEGSIFIDNGIFIKPIPNASKGTTIKLKFLGNKIGYDVNVPAGFSQRVWVQGESDLYNTKYSDMTIKSTEDVDLHVTENVINPLHEVLNFVIGPVPILDIRGIGNIDINVKGNRQKPRVWGVFNVKKGSVCFIKMPDLLMKDAETELTFNGENAVFVTKNGTVNGQKFDIKGVCTMLGKFDFDVRTEKQSSSLMYKAIRNSTLVPQIQNALPKLDKIEGDMDLALKTYGVLDRIENLEFGKNAFVQGEIKLKNNEVEMFGVKACKTNGNIKFDINNTEADLSAIASESPLKIKAKIKGQNADLELNIPKLNPNLLLQNLNYNSTDSLPFVSLVARYKGSVSDIEYNKICLVSKIIASNPRSDLKFTSGEFSINSGKSYIKNLKGYIDYPQNSFEADLKINNTFDNYPKATGFVHLRTPDVKLLNKLFMHSYMPKNIREFLKNIEFRKGAVDCLFKISDNKITTSSDLSGIAVTYVPTGLPLEVVNGSFSIKNNDLIFNKLNLLADKMPILADGEVKNIFGKRTFDFYINSKPQQEFIDKYVNKKQVYPLKIKGDIVCWAKLKGNENNFDLKSSIYLAKGASIYHYGATIGDIENSILIDADTKVIDKHSLKIKEFVYDKLIESLNGKQTRLNLVDASGGIDLLNDDFIFKDLIIKTSNPADARIFNIIFRKPNIKQGLFTSNIKINGRAVSPHITGDFHIFETNIPFLDTMLKNINIVFKDRTITFKAKGEVMGNDLLIEGVLKNKLSSPYVVEKADIYTKNMDLNNFVNVVKTAPMNKSSQIDDFGNININSLVLNNVKLKADSLVLRNIHSTNVDATVNLSEKGVLDVSHFDFDIASGNIDGSYRYNLKNNETKLNLNAKDIDANEISIALFDLENQIYGDLTGSLSLACNGTDYEHCMQTLSGETKFRVKNGKMPKLGSLEYLLKAGNLIKGGITGVSINGVIDIITPLKTGEFSDIEGNIRIKDGFARTIEIVTSGKDLNLFIGGTYNFATSNADMQVLGLLARKISTMFGPVGNLSINTLFNVIPGVDLSKESDVLNKINKIPGIELSSKVYRKFIAEIKGNIKGDNYVKSFEWIN